ncbi:MAG: radical SAM protein [Deltaproteobacteria bacterium]|nr:radical SAM protein [Deltaproteobacteria bacterium]
MISRKLIQKAKTLLEKEKGAVRKPWGGRISICLLYPNSYHVGMSNLGFQAVYQRLNSEDDIVCERAFLPDPEDLGEHRRTQTPLLSLESQKPLSGFDLLAFSISFENDFLNILTLLDLARIPLERHLRGEKDPLIMAGGVAVFLNPEPLSEFFDLFVLGEAEEVIGEFLEVYRHSGRGRKDLLRKLAGVEGIYVPEFYHVTYAEDGRIGTVEPEAGLPGKVKRRWISKIDRFPTQSSLFTPDTEFREMAVVEVNRGCPRGCRFCAACFVYHPFRNRSLSLLESLSREALLKEKRIGLAGTAISDYPSLLPLCKDILSHGGGVSIASLRVDAITPSLADCLKRGGVRAAAIAPEAGSERLRKVIKKGYGDDEILKAVRTLVEGGLSQMKSYFLIGLPSETDEEVRAILSLSKKIEHQIVSCRLDSKRRWKLVLSVNPFVPKPATPFQWVPFEDVSALKRKLKILRSGVRGEKNIEMIHDLPKWAYIQALLSRGDRRVGKVVMATHRHQGNWEQALRETSLNPDFFVYRRRDLDEIFPWDFIDHGIPKEKLKKEYVAAMKEAGVKI